MTGARAATCVLILAGLATVCPHARGAIAPGAAGPPPDPTAEKPRLPLTLPLGPTLRPPREPLPPITAEDLQDGWRTWQEAWTRRDATPLAEAERAMYILMTRAAAPDLEAMRDTMAERYDATARADAADPFRLGALAHTLVLAAIQDCLLKARLDRPARLDEEAVRAFLGRVAAYRQARESAVRWSFRTLEHAVAGAKDAAEREYLLVRVMTLVRTIPEYADEAADPGPWVAALGRMKGPLAVLAPEGDPRRGRWEIMLDDFQTTMARLAGQAADRRAVRSLVARHREAYNAKDAAAYRAVFLPDSWVAQVLAARPMEDTIGFTEWELETEDPYEVWVAGDTARIEALARYRDKDGRLRGYQIAALRARRTAAGWRLE